MAAQEIATYAAQVDALDAATARRVARLVLECQASIPLALSAVQDANNASQPHNAHRLARVLAYIGAVPWMSTR